MRLILESISSTADVKVHLRPEDGGDVLVLDSESREMFPLFSEYEGQLVLFVSFERFIGGRGDQAWGDGIRQYVMASSGLPMLQSLWLGRLATTWSGEPQIIELIPIVSPEDHPIKDLPLSGALHQVYRQRWMQERVTVCFGVSAVLIELQRHVNYHHSRARSTAEAIMRLAISGTELDAHAPYLLRRVEQLIADVQQELAALDARLQTAEQTFELVVSAIAKQQQPLRGQERLYQAWLSLQSNKEGVDSVAPTSA